MTVEPIKDKSKIEEMYKYLNHEKGLKYGLLFKFGINTGLRISDILPIKVYDIYDKNHEFHEYLSLKEKKTGKEKKIVINNTLREAINAFVVFNKLSHKSFLFASKKGGHIGRVQAYRVLKESADTIGLENFGTHSLRKTWGYWTYKISEHNIGLIMDAFNHSSQKITLRYIGINQEEKDKLYSLVQL
jgi:integrase